MGRTASHAIFSALLLLVLQQENVCARFQAGGGQVRPVNHSFARPAEAIVRHIDLNLAVDFTKKRLAGRASLEIEARPGVTRLILDTRDLIIRGVTLGKGNAPASYTLGEAVSSLGRPLIIDITPETRIVNVDYTTSPDAAALQWVQAGRTAGGKMMFLYTQSEPILARSWIPCQDNPDVRITYRAVVKTPPGMMAVMSATNVTKRNPAGMYRMEMNSPIPSYLIALAVGDLEFRKIGSRTGVYAEPSIVGRAREEFADAERMLAAAESLYGPYRWGRWDLLVLPPSFPIGGMENPRLTFVTPTILAGDRSLVSLIVHELSHSWAGNLVTNANWNEQWLNEGMTTYLERRITRALSGSEVADLETAVGYHELLNTVAELGATNSDTRLYEDLSGRDPITVNRDVVYEKGYLFLRTLEDSVGQRRWDSFLRTYFDRFGFQSMTTVEFLKYVRGLLAPRDSTFEKRLGVDEWVNGTGIPTRMHPPASKLIEQVNAQLQELRSGTQPGQLKTSGWRAGQWVYFLQSLPDTIATLTLGRLDAAFKFSSSQNSEIAAAWLLVVARARYQPSYAAIQDFLIRVGRLKYIEPIYTTLCRSPEGREQAAGIYARARNGYHPTAVDVIDAIVKWQD